MKIAIIGSRGYPYVYSGYETFVKELGERLVKNGIDVTIYCHKNLFDDYPKTVNGINLVYIRTIETKSLSQFVHSLQAFIHACFCKYNLVLAVNSANGPFGLFLKAFRKKSIINVDGLEWMRPKWKGMGAKYFRLASKLATKFYDQVVTDSFEMQKVYLKEFKTDSRVIAYGAYEKFSSKPELINKWRLQKQCYYLVVARLVADNNAALIVDEFARSASTKQLVIVGDVPYRDKYAEEVKQIKDKRIIFTGYVSDQEELAELYLNSFAYLHGHEFGGTNPAMLKALGYGCAICALDTVFNREMLDDNIHGIYFNKEENSLANLIHWMEKSPSELDKFRGKARQRIKKNYTWKKISDQYCQLFNELL